MPRRRLVIRLATGLYVVGFIVGCGGGGPGDECETPPAGFTPAECVCHPAEECVAKELNPATEQLECTAILVCHATGGCTNGSQ